MWPGHNPPVDLFRAAVQEVGGGASGASRLLLLRTDLPCAWLKHSYRCLSLTIQRVSPAVDVTTSPIGLNFGADAATQTRAGSTVNFDAEATPTNKLATAR